MKGGVENNYVYPPDPVNDFDLTGMFSLKNFAKKAWQKVKGGWNKAKNVAKKAGQKREEFIAWQYNNPRAADALLMLAGARGGGGARGNTGGKGFGNRATVAAQARQLGYTKMIPAHKAPFPSHGQPVFQKGNRYITRDVDSHKGGYWKIFTPKGGGNWKRETWNQDLTIRVGN